MQRVNVKQTQNNLSKGKQYIVHPVTPQALNAINHMFSEWSIDFWDKIQWMWIGMEIFDTWETFGTKESKETSHFCIQSGDGYLSCRKYASILVAWMDIISMIQEPKYGQKI